MELVSVEEGRFTEVPKLVIETKSAKTKLTAKLVEGPAHLTAHISK